MALWGLLDVVEDGCLGENLDEKGGTEMTTNFELQLN